MKQKTRLKLMAAALACLILLLPLNADAASDIQKIEVVFGQLARDGTVERVFLVNHFDVPEAAVFSDYGDYLSISRLTDLGEITELDDHYEITSDPGRFYYQGELANPELPWLFRIEALLDGNPVPMDELSGKSGELVLSVSIKKHEDYHAFSDFYAIQTTVSLPFEHAIHVSAEHGTVAMTGDASAVTFMSLPGQEDTFAVSATVQDFAMPGIQIAAVPLNYDVDLESLIPADESFDVQELFDAVTALSDGGDALLESAAALTDGFAELAEGFGELGEAGQEIVSGARTLRFGITDFRSGIGAYLDGVKATADGAGLLHDGVLGLAEGLETLAAETDALKDGANAIRDGLGSLSDGIAEQDFSGLSDLTDGAAQFSAGLTSLNEGLTAYQSGVDRLAGEGTMLLAGLADVPESAPPAEGADVFAARFGITDAAAASEPYASMLATMAVQSSALNEQVSALITLKDGLAEFADGLTALSESLTPLATGFADLETNFATLESGLDGLSEDLGGLSQLRFVVSMLAGGQATFADGLGSYLDGVGEIAAGVTATDGLADGVASLHDGLNQLSEEGVQLKDGAGDLRIGSRRLEDGLRQYADGVQDAAAGTASFGDGLTQYLDGVASLAGGLNTFNDATAAMAEDVEAQVETELRRILGSDFVPVSFASEKNTSIETIQFVLMTDAIENGN